MTLHSKSRNRTLYLQKLPKVRRFSHPAENLRRRKVTRSLNLLLRSAFAPSGAAFLSEPRLTMRACGGAAQVRLSHSRGKWASATRALVERLARVSASPPSASGCERRRGPSVRVLPRPSRRPVPMELNRVSPHGWRGGRDKQAWSMAAAVSMLLIR